MNDNQLVSAAHQSYIIRIVNSTELATSLGSRHANPMIRSRTDRPSCRQGANAIGSQYLHERQLADFGKASCNLQRQTQTRLTQNMLFRLQTTWNKQTKCSTWQTS